LALRALKWGYTIALDMNEIYHDLPRLRAGGGSIYPCHLQQYHGTYLYKAGIKNGAPVTFHMARTHNERDLEIYRIAVQKWNKK